MVFLSFVFSSVVLWACPDYSGLWQFRTHHLGVYQTGCDSVEITRYDLRLIKRDFIKLKLNSQVESNKIIEFDGQGGVSREIPVMTNSSFSDEGALNFEIDNPEDYNLITSTDYRQSADGKYFVQTNRYMTRNPKEVVETQIVYGVRRK